MALSLDDPMPPDNRGSLKLGGSDIAALYRSERERLTRFFARRVAPHEVGDFVQETFRRLLGAERERAVQVDNPQGYLTVVAGNLVRHRNRSLAQRASEAAVPLDEERLAGPDPRQTLENRDLLKRVDAALATLKPRTREIFLMSRSDGLSYAEIAETTGISVKGVEKQMTKALSHIRRKLDRA